MGEVDSQDTDDGDDPFADLSDDDSLSEDSSDEEVY